MLAVIIANIWRGTSFSMIVYAAALQDVPPEITEAAEVGGGRGWQRLVYITLPTIRRSISSNLMLTTLQTLSVFTLIFSFFGQFGTVAYGQLGRLLHPLFRPRHQPVRIRSCVLGGGSALAGAVKG